MWNWKVSSDICIDMGYMFANVVWYRLCKKFPNDHCKIRLVPLVLFLCDPIYSMPKFMLWIFTFLSPFVPKFFSHSLDTVILKLYPFAIFLLASSQLHLASSTKHTKEGKCAKYCTFDIWSVPIDLWLEWIF